MRYASVFSGVEAASVAWAPLGWKPVCFAEVDPFPCAVLGERFPGVPNLGDVRKVDWDGLVARAGRPDVVVGGSPCQSFSVAGRREGLGGESGLMLEYIRAVRDLRPRWLVWENVPGVLSIDGGRAFATLLDEMAQLGYDCAWRVLDAQFFGVAQRRRRVFLVGRAGGGGRAAAVLFERDSVRGNTLASRKKREAIAAAARRSPESAGVLAGDAGCLNPEDPQSKRIFTPASCGPTLSSGTEEGMNIQPSVLMANSGCAQHGEEVACTLTARYDSSPCPDRGQNVICMADDNAKAAIDENMSGSLKCGGSPPAIAGGGTVVRRLTPRECERLQGFPDDWTKIPYRGRPAEECPDGPRYKAMGNSMAVPVMRWIGERIDFIEGLDGGGER